jgi:hypothetical protein
VTHNYAAAKPGMEALAALWLAQPGSTRILATEIARTFNGFFWFICVLNSTLN